MSQALAIGSPQLAATDRKQRPKVLLVGPFPPTKGGITTFMLTLMASPLAQDFEFVAFTTSRPPKRNVTDNWGYSAVLRGGVGRMLLGIGITLWHFTQFPFVVLWRRIDIVQVQSSDYQVYFEGAVYVLLARLLRRKVLFRLGGAFDLFHGNAGPFERKLISAVLPLPHYLIAQSEYARAYIRSAGRRGPMVLLPNWTLEQNIADQPRGFSATPVCLFICNLEAVRKGVEEVFDAAQRLADRCCPARFHFLAMPPSLIERLGAMNLPNVAAVEGPASHARVLQAMRDAQIFLLPSHAEGFPNSLVEAMAAGMACIATPVGAVPEMTSNGEAIIMPVGDGGALANAIERLTRDAALFETMAGKAQEKVRATYVAKAALPELADAYVQLVKPAFQR